MIKTLKLGREGNVLNLIKGIYEKATVNIILNGENLKSLLLRSEQVRMSALTASIQFCPRGFRQSYVASKRKCIAFGKEE